MADILSNLSSALSSGLKGISQQNNQFKAVAAQQNSSISRFIKDIGRFFSSQAQQQNSMNSAIGDLAQTTAINSGKIDQTNSLIRDSISVQNQMLVELRSVSGSFRKFTSDFDENQKGGNSLLSTIVSILSGAAVGAAATAGIGALGGLQGTYNSITNAASYMGSGVSNVLGNLGLGGGSAGSGNVDGGFVDTVGPNQRGVGDRLSVAEMTKLAKEAGFNNEQAAIMGAIGAAESGGRSIKNHPSLNATDNSYGIWQINMKDDMGPERRNQFNISSNEELLNPKKNADAAHEIFKQQGFSAWTTYTSGKYLDFLGTAKKSLQEGDGDVIASSSPINLQKYSLKPPSHVQGLKPDFSAKLGRFLAAAEAAGHPIQIYSGYRSVERQQQLWEGALRKYGSPAAARKWVAPPGRSRHNFGLATDLAFNGVKLGEGGTQAATQWAHQNAGKFGLNFRMGHEPWHIEPSNGSSMLAREDTGGGMYNEGSPSTSATGPGGSFEGNEITSANMFSKYAELLNGTELSQFSSLFGSIAGAMGTMAGGVGNVTSLLGLGGMGGLGGIGGMGLGMFGGLGSMFQGIEGMFSNIGSMFDTSKNEDKNETKKPDMQMEADGDLTPNKRIDKIQNAAVQSDSMMFNVASALQNQNASQPAAAPQQNQLPSRNDQGRYVISGGLTSSTSWYQQLAGKINYDEVMKLKGGVYA